MTYSIFKGQVQATENVDVHQIFPTVIGDPKERVIERLEELPELFWNHVLADNRWIWS
jgi:hypothetical protein